MTETATLRKNKICLADYNYQKDIENRLLLATFSPFDLEVLEEILFSPLQVSLKKFAKNVGSKEEKLVPIIEKLEKIGLLTLKEDAVTVDKEMRKYFETEIMAFDEHARPGMEYAQALLKKVPIHVLPVWYSIPRSSNNIFESLVERYLLTPTIFQRYLNELNLGEAPLVGILHDVYTSPELKVSAKTLMKKYGLTKEQFAECMLLLEFNLVCVLSYEKKEDAWEEVVTPFHEWLEYLRFLHATETTPLPSPASVKRKRPSDFAFVDDMGKLLLFLKKNPLPLASSGEIGETALQIVQKEFKDFSEAYTKELLGKAALIKLTGPVKDHLYALEGANEWLDLSLEDRARALLRHPLNRICSKELPAHISTEKAIREAEKSILRVLDKGFVYFDDFIKGVMVGFDEQSAVMLRRVGKTWKYALPQYTEDELALINAVIFEWLFETGIVAVGTHQGKECFCVTPFGQSFFGR